MRPETKELYPPNWPEISKATIEARGNKCERCSVSPGNPYPILTVHHIDYDPSNNDPDNLKVLCQGCHLRWQQDEKRSFGQLLNRANAIRLGQRYLPGFKAK